jgi:hypothetical protein
MRALPILTLVVCAPVAVVRAIGTFKVSTYYVTPIVNAKSK